MNVQDLDFVDLTFLVRQAGVRLSTHHTWATLSADLQAAKAISEDGTIADALAVKLGGFQERRAKHELDKVVG